MAFASAAVVSRSDASAARRALAGFALSGFLAALLGAILPAWGYHLKSDFATVAHYFLSLTAGVLLSTVLTRRLLPRRGVSHLLVAACALSCAALVVLALASPPTLAIWRMGGLVYLGIATGLLNSAIFHAISDPYHQNPAATISLGGVFFGLGCLAAALVVASAFYAWSVGAILGLAALIPGLFGVLYARTPFHPEPVPRQPNLRQALRDLRSPAAVLLALLLFFQFGNEWTVAGWLTLFLIQRLGISPESALLFLGFYWTALLLGRVAALAVLPRLAHGRLLLGAAAAALFGCVVLLSTDNRFGAAVAIALIGAGFAPIYPLVAEKIGHRFAYYHPGLFNGVFSLAMVGAMLAPATAGYMAHAWGVGSVMFLPLAGTLMVFVLTLLIWLESKIGG
ncbi:MAG: MFS transporter [Bryobacteraceae bacterium]